MIDRVKLNPEEMFNRIVRFKGSPVDMDNDRDREKIVKPDGRPIDPLNDRDVENYGIEFKEP